MFSAISPADGSSLAAASVPAISMDTTIPFMAAGEFPDLSYSEDQLEWLRELTSREAPARSDSPGDSLLGALLARSRPLLKADEERALFQRMNYVRFQAEAIRSALPSTRRPSRRLAKMQTLMQEAAAIRRQIAESNLRLVVAISRKHSNSPQEFQEFVSEGLLILLGAIDKFDYSRGFRFSTYATHSVQRHLFRLCARSQRDSQRFVRTAGDDLASMVCAAEPEEMPEQEAAAVYEKLMQTAKGRLSDREEAVLERRFGTGGRGGTQTLREIAAETGLSKERVRQIQIAALRKLKDAARELNLLPVSG